MKVEKITGIVPFTEKSIDINVQGRNLIFTGKNGCGKTQLLGTIFEVLSQSPNYNSSLLNYEKELDSLRETIQSLSESLNDNLKNQKKYLSKIGEMDDGYQKVNIVNKLNKLTKGKVKIEKVLEDSRARKELVIDSITSLGCYEQVMAGKNVKFTKIVYGDKHEDKFPIILFFEALRKSDFQQVQSISSMDLDTENIRKNSQKNNRNPNAGSFIEKFLANWEVQSALREKKCDYSVSKDLADWKEKLVQSLRILLDDATTELEFDDRALNYVISQHGKSDFSFRDLSSGYSAILKVFSELLMQTEVSDFSGL